MNDCPNADMRDLLPDLVNGRLDAEARAAVEAHVAGCADCRAEVALLRAVRSAMHISPALDLSAIASAIPAYRAPVRRSWVGWRLAAAVTLLVAGGSSVVLLNRAPSASVSVAVTKMAPVAEPIVAAAIPAVRPSVDSVATAPVVSPAPAYGRPAAVPAVGHELAMAGGSLTDLSDGELDALLRDIESLDAVTTTDVDVPVISPIPPAAAGRGAP